MVFNKYIIYDVLKDRKEKESVLKMGFLNGNLVIEVGDEKPEYLNRSLRILNDKSFLNTFNGVYLAIHRNISKESRKKLLNALNNPEGLKLILKDPDIIDSHTKNVDSPVPEISRILKNDFKISNVFCGVNSKSLIDYLGTSLSVNRIHEVVLNNFDGVKFRKQNGGFAYTLKPINVGGLNG